MLGTLFGLLALYWFLRITFCRFSFIQAVLSLISLALCLILPKEFPLVPLIATILLLTFSFYRSVRNKNGPFRFSTLAGWLTVYAVGGVIALLTLVFKYQENEVIGHVVLKGKDQSEWVSWKNPSQPSVESSWVSSYEVEVQDAKGNKLFNDFVVGDLVGVRAQVILFNWPLKLLGFSHLYRLELVHNGYTTAERHQFFPHAAYALPFPMKLFEKVWNQLYLGNWKIFGIQSTTLESSYFPLRDGKLSAAQQEYDLVIGSSGLSSVRSSAQ